MMLPEPETNPQQNKFGALSVNQLGAQITLLEMRKALNIEDYPLKIEQQSVRDQGVSTRAASNRRSCEILKVFFWGFKEDLIYLFQNKFFV